MEANRATLEGAKNILSILEAAGYEAYIIGGAVRDYCLKKEPLDFDIVTSARPDEIRPLMEEQGFAVKGLVGQVFGVLILSTPQGTYEVSTFRSESYGEDAHRPEVVTYADTLEEDVLRRDFTVNGLAMDVEGHIIDYVGGLGDLKHKSLETIGDPVERFTEDALRLFRACRFVAQHDFKASRELLEAMPKAFYRVKGLSLERVKSEIEKILVAPYVAKGLDILVRSGLADECCKVKYMGKEKPIAILPELSHLVGLSQNKQFHAFDGWFHTLAAVQHTAPDLTVRWAALLHDVAKGLPHIRGEKDGKLTDYGHDKEGAHIAEDILHRFGYPPKMCARVSWLVSQHMKFHYFACHEEANLGKWIRKEAQSGKYRSQEELKEAFQQLTALCVGDAKACGRPNMSTGGLEALGEAMEAYCERMPVHTKELHYSRELISLLGNQTGCFLPKVLKEVQEEQLENTEEALMTRAKKWLIRHK